MLLTKASLESIFQNQDLLVDERENELSDPIITIIVVVLNGAKTLQRCINSVAQQNYPLRQLIIIDGGSSDGTVQTIEANLEHIDDWCSEPDRGIYHAMNKGVERATGDWIIFLGADDYLISPDTLRMVAKKMASIRPEETRLVYGKVAVVSNDGSTICYWGDEDHQLEGLPHQGTFHHRSFFEIHGYFDESFRIAGDYEMLLRELKSGNVAHFLGDIIVAAFSWGGVSTASKTAKNYWMEFARARRMNGLFPYTLGWCKCVIKILSLFLRSGFVRRADSTKRDDAYLEMRAQSPSGVFIKFGSRNQSPCGQRSSNQKEFPKSWTA